MTARNAIISELHATSAPLFAPVLETFRAFQLSRQCGEGHILLVPRERGVPTAKLGRVGATLFSPRDPCRQTRDAGATNYTDVQ